MTKKIMRSICLAAFVVLASTAGLFCWVLYGHFSDREYERLKVQTEIIAEKLSLSGEEYQGGSELNEYRVTVIDKDGSVIYDSRSNSDEMENHLERKEIKDAFMNGEGESRRYSATLTERYLYYAKRLDNGTVVRLSVAHSSVLKLLLDMVYPLAAIVLLSLAFSVFLAGSLSRSVVKPLNELNLDEPLENKVYDELAPLLRRIDSQQRLLKQQRDELQRKTDELNTIIDSMEEGFLLLNSKMHVLSINSAARTVLDIKGEAVGKEIHSVCRNLIIQEALRNAQTGEKDSRTLEIGGRVYQVSASPVLSKESTAGVALLFFDVTEREKAESMRREFTANVSHELKTPLHSIAGYAELMANNMVKPEDYADCVARIYSEAKRMIRLVEDIINLSQLDEGAYGMERVDISLFEMAESVIRSLDCEARKAGIRLSLAGTHACIAGVPQLIHEIIYNICENAIKYNRRDGEVTVNIDEDGNDVVLSVKDTGIGVPKEEISRIFERFYRVDKSRSKEVGGTGLGLSIVKHAAKAHNARIEIESTVGEGTTVIVRFPVR